MADLTSRQIPPASGWFEVTKNKDGSISVMPSQTFLRYVIGQGGVVQNVNSGPRIAIDALNAQIAALQAQLDAQAAAGAGQGDGTGTSNSTYWSGFLSNAATWVVAATVTVTPGGAGGDYTITVSPSAYFQGHLSDDGFTDTSFSGNWRLVEEETGGGTPVTLASGTFDATYTAATEVGGEGGPPITVPATWTTGFAGLPTGLIAANYAVQSDIRFEMQRSAGTNEITAPGLFGTMGVVWTA